jgi:hypothetical protein
MPVNQSLSAQPITLNVNSAEKYVNIGKSTIGRAFDMSNFFGKKTKTKNVDKAQISGPTQFVHVGHVGLTNNNFEVNLSNEDDSSKKMKELLSLLNVPVKNNKKTEIFVENFIREHGGNDRFNQEIQRHTTLPPPPPPLPQSPIKNRTENSPTSQNATSSSTGNLNTRVSPAIPQTASTVPKMQPVFVPKNPHVQAPSPPPPPPMSLIPPPPPMPMSSNEFLPPPPPPPPLLSDHSTITTATIPPKTDTKPVKNIPSAPTSLLDSIKAFEGFKNKVNTQTSQVSDNSPQGGEASILDQLKNELLKRAQFLSNFLNRNIR